MVSPLTVFAKSLASLTAIPEARETRERSGFGHSKCFTASRSTRTNALSLSKRKRIETTRRLAEAFCTSFKILKFNLKFNTQCGKRRRATGVKYILLRQIQCGTFAVLSQDKNIKSQNEAFSSHLRERYWIGFF